MSISSRRLPVNQLWYIDPMQEYGVKANRGGVCYGVANEGIDAALVKGIPSFNERFYLIKKIIDSIKSDPSQTFSGIIENVRKKSIRLTGEAKAETLKEMEHIRKEALLEVEKKKDLDNKEKEELLNQLISQVIQDRVDIKISKELTSEERMMLSIPGFFESVELYYQAWIYPHLFEEHKKPHIQEPVLSSQLASSTKLDQLGGRAKVDSFSGIYSQNEIEVYLESLRKTLEEGQPPFTAPFAMLLRNANHAITIIYDDKKWIFIDPNHLPSRIIDSNKKAASKILKAFFATNDNKNVAFMSEIFAAKKYSEKAETYIKTWKTTPAMVDMHSVAPEKVKLVDSQGGTWLGSALLLGDLETVKTIFSLKTQDGLSPLLVVDTMLYKGFTPLIMAAQLGHVDIVRYLLDQGADFNKKLNNEEFGATPLDQAIVFGHLEILKMLLDSGAALNSNSLYSAAENGYLPIVQELVKRGVKLDDEGDIALVAAAENGHFDVVKWLLVNGVTLKPMVNASRAPLLLAVKNGHEDIVAELLDRGAQIDIVTDNKSTLLHIAVKNQHLTVVAKLLKYGKIDINQSNESGLTPLKEALVSGNLDMVKMLLDHGAKIESIDISFAAKGGQLSVLEELIARGVSATESGDAALEIAAENGHLDIIKWLLNKGVSLPSPAKPLPLFLAVKYGHEDVVAEFLARGAPLDLLTEDRYTILDIATVYKKLPIVEMLIKTGKFDLSQRGVGGNTVLHFAAQGGDIDIVNFLLNHPAIDPSLINDKKMTPLHLAAQKGHAEIVKRFMAKGIAPDERALRAAAAAGQLATVREFIGKGILPNETTLIEAAARNRVEVVEELLKYPLNINKGLDKHEGTNALHNAARNGHLEVVKLLLNKGALLDYPATDNLTALYLAVEYKEIEVVKELLNRGAKVNPDLVERNESLLGLLKDNVKPGLGNDQGSTLIHVAVEKENIETLRLLMRLPVDLNVWDKSGRTPMHIAAELGNIPMLETLINVRKNFKNQPDKDDNRPIHIAARAGNKEMVKFLAGAGANPDLQNKQGYTPMHIALEIRSAEMVQDLMRLRPDLNLQNHLGQTSLHIAVNEKNSNAVIGMLIENGVDINIKDKNGKSPLHLTLEQGQWEAAVLMLTAAKETGSLMQGELQPHRERLMEALVQQLKRTKEKDALDKLAAIIRGENALGKLLKTKPESSQSLWTSFFAAKETPEIAKLKSLQAELTKKVKQEISPRQTKQV